MRKLLLFALTFIAWNSINAQCLVTPVSMTFNPNQVVIGDPFATLELSVGSAVTFVDVTGWSEQSAVSSPIMTVTSGAPNQGFDTGFVSILCNGVFTPVAYDFSTSLNYYIISDDFIVTSPACNATDGSICSINGEEFIVDGVTSVGGCITGLGAGDYVLEIAPINLGGIVYYNADVNLSLGTNAYFEVNGAGELEVVVEGGEAIQSVFVGLNQYFGPIPADMWSLGCFEITVTTEVDGVTCTTSILDYATPTCAMDFTGDGYINVSDLGGVLGAFGDPHIGGFNCDGAANVADIGFLLANFPGPCE